MMTLQLSSQRSPQSNRGAGLFLMTATWCDSPGMETLSTVLHRPHFCLDGLRNFSEEEDLELGL